MNNLKLGRNKLINLFKYNHCFNLTCSDFIFEHMSLVYAKLYKVKSDIKEILKIFIHKKLPYLTAYRGFATELVLAIDDIHNARLQFHDCAVHESYKPVVNKTIPLEVSLKIYVNAFREKDWERLFLNDKPTFNMEACLRQAQENYFRSSSYKHAFDQTIEDAHKVISDFYKTGKLNI